MPHTLVGQDLMPLARLVQAAAAAQALFAQPRRLPSSLRSSSAAALAGSAGGWW
jgi:hypothetical protein